MKKHSIILYGSNESEFCEWNIISCLKLCSFQQWGIHPRRDVKKEENAIVYPVPVQTLQTLEGKKIMIEGNFMVMRKATVFPGYNFFFIIKMSFSSTITIEICFYFYEMWVKFCH